MRSRYCWPAMASERVTRLEITERAGAVPVDAHDPGSGSPYPQREGELPLHPPGETLARTPARSGLPRHRPDLRKERPRRRRLAGTGPPQRELQFGELRRAPLPERAQTSCENFFHLAEVAGDNYRADNDVRRGRTANTRMFMCMGRQLWPG
jgi:hypothetical protein